VCEVLIANIKVFAQGLALLICKVLGAALFSHTLSAICRNKMNTEYKYEVAFSFLQQDETLAQQINDLLQERMPTFIYPEHQLQLAGRDGELLLEQVFGSQARLVVILYRNEWGRNRWTRIEQDAIRNRAFDLGYDFCLLIPLDEPPTTPKWYPKPRIWIGLKRWGIEAAAAVIEARVQEAGGSAREETIVDRSARLQRKIAAAEKRKSFLCSGSACKLADDEANKLYSRIEQLIASISNEHIPLIASREHRRIEITCFCFVVQVYWVRSYANTLDHSGLSVRMLKLNVAEGPERDMTELRRIEYQFDLNDAEEYGWRAADLENKFFLTDQLADLAIRMILDRVSEYRLAKLQ